MNLILSIFAVMVVMVVAVLGVALWLEYWFKG